MAYSKLWVPRPHLHGPNPPPAAKSSHGQPRLVYARSTCWGAISEAPSAEGLPQGWTVAHPCRGQAELQEATAARPCPKAPSALLISQTMAPTGCATSPTRNPLTHPRTKVSKAAARLCSSGQWETQCVAYSSPGARCCACPHAKGQDREGQSAGDEPAPAAAAAGVRHSSPAACCCCCCCT